MEHLLLLWSPSHRSVWISVIALLAAIFCILCLMLLHQEINFTLFAGYLHRCSPSLQKEASAFGVLVCVAIYTQHLNVGWVHRKFWKINDAFYVVTVQIIFATAFVAYAIGLYLPAGEAAYRSVTVLLGLSTPPVWVLFTSVPSFPGGRLEAIRGAILSGSPSIRFWPELDAATRTLSQRVIVLLGVGLHGARLRAERSLGMDVAVPSSERGFALRAHEIGVSCVENQARADGFVHLASA